MENRLTILEDAIRTLSAINVPVGLLESIGIPIYQVRSRLAGLYDEELKEQVRKKAQAESGEAKPEETEEATE